MELIAKHVHQPTNLGIEPSLVGRSHEFTLDGVLVRLQIPSKVAGSGTPGRANHGLRLVKYLEREGSIVPLVYEVLSVSIHLAVDTPIELPDGILEHPSNAYDLVSESQCRQLDETCEHYDQLADRAFEYWVAVLRWRSGNGRIGRGPYDSHESGWGTRLASKQDGTRVWSWHPAFEVSALYNGVSDAMWEAASESLQKAERPPLHVELMFDADEHIRLGDLTRAASDLAIACESVFRHKLSLSLPADVSDAVRSHVDDAPIRRVIEKLLPPELTPPQRTEVRALSSVIHQLFDVRNDIFHGRQIAELDYPTLKRYREAAGKVADLLT